MTTTRVIDHTINTILGDDNIYLWIDAFLQAKKSENLSKHSIRFYDKSLQVFTNYCNAQSVKNINQITPNFLRDFILYLESEGHNTGGINVFFRSIKAWLNWFEAEIEPENWKNPIHKVKPPKVIQEPLQGITKEEFNLLLSKCPKNTFNGIRDSAILMVLMDTGIRAEELTNIKIQDISTIEGSISIVLGKGRKPRTVFIGSKTRKQIRKYLKYRGKDNAYLFINRDGVKLVYSALRQIVRRLCEQAEIKDVSLHDFRRGFTIESLRNGVDTLTLSRLLGHTNLNLLLRYAKQNTDDLQRSYKSVIDE